MEKARMIMDNLKIKKNRYQEHKRNATKRGIEFKFTYEEWIGMWEASGKWDQRGHGADKYCMARHNDTGPYSVNNVSIQTNSQNNYDGAKKRDHANWLNSIISARKDPVWRKKITGQGNNQFKGLIKGTCIATGKEIIFCGAKEIRNAGFLHQHVYKCINGKLKTHKGYIWQRI